MAGGGAETNPTEGVEGFILAGGASSRMGTDKARLMLSGETFAGRVAAALRALTPTVRVVGAGRGQKEFGLPVVPDLFARRGALGGIHAALAHCRAPWAAIVSCDLPFVTGELLKRLDSLRLPDKDAVAPIQPDGREQPLCALYSRAACLELSEQLIRSDELRPRALLRLVRTRRVAFEELSDLPGSELFFRNVNTPEDYEEAKKVISRQ